MAFQQLPPNKIISWLEARFDCKPRKNNTEYRINNPFDGDTGYHFSINPYNGFCHDWRSDSWSGAVNPKTGKHNCSFTNFVKLYLKCSWRDAIASVVGQADAKSYLSAKPAQREQLADVAVKLPDGVEPLASSTDKQSQMLKNWLYTRGYTDDSIRFNDLQCYNMEVYWPYYEFEEMVYWQSRSRMNKNFRFPDAEIYNNGVLIGKTEGTKGDYLYGFDDIKTASYVIIVEAIFGKQTLGEQVVASGGAALTPTQINKLKLLSPVKGVILAPDNDSAGLKSIISNFSLLKNCEFPIFYSTPPSIEYEKDGKREFIKDWNELLTELHWNTDRIRETHDKSIKRVTATEFVDITRRIATSKSLH